MALVTRLFTAGDGVNLWELLNEIKGWVDTLAKSGGAAVFWTGDPEAKTIVSGETTSINFDVEVSAGLAPTFSGDTIKLPAGTYRVDAQLTFSGNVNGYRILSLLKNPSVTVHKTTLPVSGTVRNARVGASQSSTTTVQLTKIIKLVSTDTLMIVCQQNSGVNLDIDEGVPGSELMIQRIGD